MGTSHADQVARQGNATQQSTQKGGIAGLLRNLGALLPGAEARAADAARLDAAHSLYLAAVARARTAAFYAGMGVPDTENGRFEMIVLHLVVMVRALRQHGQAGKALAQEMIDVFIKDMDRSLREGGTGDLGVGKKVKQMAGCYHARSSVLEPLLNEARAGAMVPALASNLFELKDPSADDAAQVERLAEYLVSQDQATRAVPADDLLSGALEILPFAPAAQAAS